MQVIFFNKPAVFFSRMLGEQMFSGATRKSTTAFRSKTAIRILKKAAKGIPIRINVEGYTGRIYIDLLDCRAVGFHGGTNENPKFVTLKYIYRLNKKRSVYNVSNH